MHSWCFCSLLTVTKNERHVDVLAEPPMTLAASRTRKVQHRLDSLSSFLKKNICRSQSFSACVSCFCVFVFLSAVLKYGMWSGHALEMMVPQRPAVNIPQRHTHTALSVQTSGSQAQVVLNTIPVSFFCICVYMVLSGSNLFATARRACISREV